MYKSFKDKHKCFHSESRVHFPARKHGSTRQDLSNLHLFLNKSQTTRAQGPSWLLVNSWKWKCSILELQDFTSYPELPVSLRMWIIYCEKKKYTTTGKGKVKTLLVSASYLEEACT